MKYFKTLLHTHDLLRENLVVPYYVFIDVL
jgi:hypothetical protein